MLPCENNMTQYILGNEKRGSESEGGREEAGKEKILSS